MGAYQDTTDVDDSIRFSDTNELIGSCCMCSGGAFASLNIEGGGGGEVDAQASYRRPRRWRRRSSGRTVASRTGDV